MQGITTYLTPGNTFEAATNTEPLWHKIDAMRNGPAGLFGRNYSALMQELQSQCEASQTCLRES